MTHLELFSGIGGFRHALDLLTQDGIMPFECIGYSEIDAKAKKNIPDQLQNSRRGRYG